MLLSIKIKENIGAITMEINPKGKLLFTTRKSFHGFINS